MKKIIVMLGAVACAACVNAASINWTISNVYSASDTTAKASGIGYLFITENTSNVDGITITTLAAVQSALDAQDWAMLASLSSASEELNANGGIQTRPTGISSDFSSGTVSGFAVIFDAEDMESASNYYLVNEGATKSVSFTSSTGAKNLAFGSQATATQTAGAWTAVPEPTSGLLMLVGLAGLALRRRRA